jgi:hypothetical protein
LIEKCTSVCIKLRENPIVARFADIANRWLNAQ